MGLFKKLREPVILKESNHLKEEYEFVKKLCENNKNTKLNLENEDKWLKVKKNINFS